MLYVSIRKKLHDSNYQYFMTHEVSVLSLIDGRNKTKLT